MAESQQRVTRICSDSSLSLGDKIELLEELGLPEEKFHQVVQKLERDQQKMLESFDLISFDGKESIQDSFSESGESSFVPVGTINVRRCGVSDYAMQFPTNTKITKKKLCVMFDIEEEEEGCYIFLDYNYFSSLTEADSYFIPQENGDYIVVFQSDVPNYGSLRTIGARLKVLDGKAPDVLTLFKNDLLSIVDDDDKKDLEYTLDNCRWKLAIYMLKNYSEEAQDILNNYIREYDRVSPNSVEFSTPIKVQRPLQSEAKYSRIERQSPAAKSPFAKKVVNKPAKPQIDYLAVFLSCYDNDERQKRLTQALINKKSWDMLKKRTKGAEAEAFAAFFEDYKQKHPEEFKQEKKATLPKEPALNTPKLEAKPKEDKSPIQVDMKLFDLDNDMTILILGETGVGKSTFINALTNYLKYTTMDEARNKGPVIVLPVQFTHQDADLNNITIKCHPTIKLPDASDRQNEKFGDGESCTQHAKAYLFQVGPSDRQTIRLLDTPGVGDTRGQEVEDKNFSDTLAFLANYKKINAILILMNPDEPRLTVMFNYCIKELLTHLHVSAMRNILYCFTKIHGTNYEPGNSLNLLDKLLKDLNEKRNLTGSDALTVSTKNVFCFDNEGFRCLCAWQSGIMEPDIVIQGYKKSWEFSVATCFNLIKRIKELDPHDIKNTLSINNIRRVVYVFSMPLAKLLYDTMEQNIAMLKSEEQKMKNLNTEEAALNIQQRRIELLVPVVESLPYPVTVCTSDKCLELLKYKGADGSDQTIANYSKKCHERCYLKAVEAEIVPNQQLKDCTAFKKYGINKCQLCECSWETHMHIRYKLTTKLQTIENKELIAKLENCTTVKQQIELKLDNLRQTREEIELEKGIILSGNAELVAFLRQNSLSAYNDSFREYTYQLIREQEIKIKKFGVPDMVLKKIRESLNDYENMVAQFEEISKTKNAKTVEQIYDIINEIRGLKHCKKLLESVEELEMLSVDNAKHVSEIKVPLQGGWVYEEMKRY